MEDRRTSKDAFEAEKLLPRLFEWKTCLFQILFVWKKMSNRRMQVKKSSVNGSAAGKGLGNATEELARSTTQSGVSFSQVPNISSSGVMTKKGSERKMEELAETRLKLKKCFRDCLKRKRICYRFCSYGKDV